MMHRTLVSLSMCLFASAALAQKKDPLIVNIDNPNFRKLVVAVPTFKSSGKDKDLETLAKDGATELSRLLSFSGLFNIMAEAAYKDLLKGSKSVAKSSKASGKSASVIEGADLTQWKGLGVESLTMAELDREPDGLVLSLKTIDINRGQRLIGKRYRKVYREDFNKVIRRYADLLLEAYTGKPGIFSTQLVFVGRKKKGAFKQVYICNFDGSNARAITSAAAPHLSPNWSRDGRFVTFTSYQDGNPDLFIYDTRTKKKRKLSGRKGLNSGANWSPKDRLVAFTGSVAGDADIYTVKPSGGKARLLIRGSGLDVDPAFSPDGKYLAFVSGRYGNPHIFRATLLWDGETRVKVTADKRLTYAGWYNATPAWSPSSDKIVFAGYDKDIDRFDLFLMNPDGKNLERLTIRAGDNESPSWSPNGQMVVFQSNRSKGRDVKGQAQLYVMNRDGSSQRRLSTELYEAETPVWGPVIR